MKADLKSHCFLNPKMVQFSRIQMYSTEQNRVTWGMPCLSVSTESMNVKGQKNRGKWNG